MWKNFVGFLGYEKTRLFAFEIYWPLEQFFLTVGQNNFGNKIPFLIKKNPKRLWLSFNLFFRTEEKIGFVALSSIIYVGMIKWKITLHISIMYENQILNRKLCDKSGVHVLLVSLFGIPIVWSISHFFGWPKKIWSTKKNFGIAKKKFGIPKKNLVDQKNEKLTGKMVYQRDWPKVHGGR